jgi:hypothetical protein
MKHVKRSSVSIATVLLTGRPGFDSRLKLEMFPFLTASRPAWWPTLIPMSLSPAVNRPGLVKLTTHLHLVPRLRMRGAIPPLPIRVHSVVLWLSTGYVFMMWYLVKVRDKFTLSYHGVQRIKFLSHRATWHSTRFTTIWSHRNIFLIPFLYNSVIHFFLCRGYKSKL